MRTNSRIICIFSRACFASRTVSIQWRHQPSRSWSIRAVRTVRCTWVRRPYRPLRTTPPTRTHATATTHSSTRKSAKSSPTSTGSSTSRQNSESAFPEFLKFPKWKEASGWIAPADLDLYYLLLILYESYSTHLCAFPDLADFRFLRPLFQTFR